MQVGQEVEEGDTLVILESMKMEMPVEAEDDGMVKEITLRGGPVGVGGRHAGCPRVARRSELASGKLLLDEPAEHVTRLKISNPDKRGALDHEILDTLAETVQGLDARCLVITGDGSMFSAGYDIGNLRREDFEERAEKLVAHPFHDAIEALDAYRYPVLAALNGHAIGGGLELALTCDIRVAARGVKLGMPPAKLGLIYSHTGLRRFIEVCGVANTTSSSTSGATWTPTAPRGWASSTRWWSARSSTSTALSLAAEIASNAPLSLKGNKRVMRALRDDHRRADPPSSSRSSSSCASPASRARTSARG